LKLVGGYYRLLRVIGVVDNSWTFRNLHQLPTTPKKPSTTFNEFQKPPTIFKNVH